MVLPSVLSDRSTALVKGDDRSQSIAAASIVAKVLRDRVMRVWARHYPAYGFERHVGYPTPEHKRALQEHGQRLRKIETLFDKRREGEPCGWCESKTASGRFRE